MWPFLVLIIVSAAVLPIVIIRENKRIAKLKKEKEKGIWDFIDDEYLPYLSSHSIPVFKFDNLTFKLSYRSKWWSVPGTLHYNPAGAYVEFDRMNYKSPQNIFIRGKDKPSRFSPGSELFFYSIESGNENNIILKLKTKENIKESNCSLKIENAPDQLKNDLKLVFI